MSDGHLFLGDDGLVFTGSNRNAWHDQAHGAVLVFAPSSQKLFEISLPHARFHNEKSALALRHPVVRSKSTPALAFDVTTPEKEGEAETSRNDRDVEMLYDFSGPKGRVLDNTPVQLMRLSLDRQFLAIQKSDVEIQVLRLSNGESYWVVCKPKAGNRILVDGVFWNTHASSPQSSQDLFLVTRLGIEQYRVSSKRRSCALHRTIGVYVHSFWYSALHSVLVVSTGSRANEIVPFAMQGASVDKLPRLVFSSAVRQCDLYLASLYGELYAVYGDAKTARLLLYRVTRDKVACVRSLHLLLPVDTRVAFSVVDNLLVCHSVEFSVSLFFDIKCDANVHDPFSHPLPVSLGTPVSRPQPRATHHNHAAALQQRSASCVAGVTVHESSHDRSSLRVGEALASKQQASLQLNHQEHASVDEHGRVVSAWRFIAPDLVQRSIFTQDPLVRTATHDHDTRSSELLDRIEIRRFRLNLDQIRKSCAQHAEILSFLLRHGDQQLAKRLALGIVREQLEEQALVPTAVRELLARVQTVSARDFRRRQSQHDGTRSGSASDKSANDTNSSDDEQQQLGSWNHYGPRAAVVPLSMRRRFFRSGDEQETGTTTTTNSLQRVSRNATGQTLVFQSDFWQFVWQPLLVHPSVISKSVLHTYLVEFIRILRRSYVPVETLTYIALVKAFLLVDKPDELYQTLQYHVATDSMELADLLLASSARHHALRQLALDMYTRLGAVAMVVQVLLDIGEVDQAIAMAWTNKKPGSCDCVQIPGSSFFNASVRSLYILEQATHSTLVVQQKLQTLLLFLRVWDRDCLHGDPVSPLAQAVAVAFPDDLVPVATRARWRQGFGFVSDT